MNRWSFLHLVILWHLFKSRNLDFITCIGGYFIIMCPSSESHCISTVVTLFTHGLPGSVLAVQGYLGVILLQNMVLSFVCAIVICNQTIKILIMFTEK